DLLVALVIRRPNLDDELRMAIDRALSGQITRRNDSEIGLPVVVVAVVWVQHIEVVEDLEFMAGHDRKQDSLERAFEALVIDSWRGNHVQHSVPDLVEAIVAEATTLLEPRWIWPEQQHAHRSNYSSGGHAPTVSTLCARGKRVNSRRR